MKLIKNLFDFEKKSIFLINLFIVILMILTFYFDLPTQYFFYTNLLLTIFLSYLFFKRSRKLAKTLITTNLFLFFYFLYPYVAEFFFEIVGNQSYLFILFYTILVSYAFLVFSGHQKDFIGKVEKLKPSLLLIIFGIGIIFGLFFYLVKEPVPTFFAEFLSHQDLLELVIFLVFTSLVIAISEQMIFAGVLFNSYKELTTLQDAFYQTSIIFVMFHIIRFEVLVNVYHATFPHFYILFISAYYILLFLFMLTGLYFYSINSKKYSGNIFYPIILHFAADFGLFLFYILGSIM